MSDLPEKISFQKVIDTLLGQSSDYQSIQLVRFSDLESDEVNTLKENWLKIDPERRKRLIKDLNEITNEDTLVCFDQVAILALEDPEPSVRINAIELLKENEQKCLIPVFIQILQTDKEKNVRAAAATALGKYVYLGEVDSIPPDSYQQVEITLLNVLDSKEHKEVRQRALESIGFSCHKKAKDQIRRAFASEDTSWVASSLFAMGRSADMYWADMVIESLDHQDQDVQLAAVRAAGELELAKAREPLLTILDQNDDLDEELHNTIIWSLSQIGGESVRAALELLMELAEEDEDEELLEFLETAFENLDFNEGMQFFELFDIDLDEDDTQNGSVNFSPDDPIDDL